MKVLVANQPPLLRECLAIVIGKTSDVEVAVAASTPAAILRSVEALQPDCVILSLEARQASPRICRTMLNRYPRTVILAIGSKKLTVYWFDGIMRSAPRECSPPSILDALRTNVGGLEDEPRSESGRHHEEMFPPSLPTTVSEVNHYEP